jgi:spectinomycin phosphotransferase
MLEKPDLPDAEVAAGLRDQYGLHIVHVAFLPLGADANTAVYRAVTDDDTPYFVKLRRGVFDETAVAVPKFLHDRGIRQIIAPLATRTQQLWATLDDFHVILYPFVAGHSGFEVNLSDHHWVDFGAALKGIHTAVVPPALRSRLPHESYSPHWREIVKAFQARVEEEAFDEPVAAALAAFLKAKRDAILYLVGRAERLGSALQARNLEFVLCHSDIHAGNILIDDDHDAVYLVDWDNPVLATKERDLMFVGGGLGGGWRKPEDEEALFYQGYGQTEIDPVALAYYRYERIVEDIAAYCERLFLTDEGGDDREEGLRQLTSQFLPNNVIEVACQSENFLPLELRSQRFG